MAAHRKEVITIEGWWGLYHEGNGLALKDGQILIGGLGPPDSTKKGLGLEAERGKSTLYV